MEPQNDVESSINGKITDDNTDGKQNDYSEAENDQKISEKEPIDNGDDDIDPLDLIANCNEIGGDLINSDNSDVWKCSDTDEESYSNQKDIDNQLIDNTDMDLIDDDDLNKKDDQSKNDKEHTYCINENKDNTTDTPIDSTDKTTDTPITSPDKTAMDTQIDSPDKTTDTPIDSPDKTDSSDKTTDSPVDSPIDNNDKDKEISDDKTVIINDRKGDDSGDSGISDTITTQNPTEISNDNDNEKNIEEKSFDDKDDNDEMDYSDFDPSLLCPEVSMAIEDTSVITETPRNNDNSSPLPYETLYSTYVDEVTGAEISFNLTPEEHNTRIKRYTNANPIEYTKIHCTACNLHLGSALEAQNNRFVHPLLKVLICKKCYNFYTSGEFEKDEDGSELYCRWCGQGGQVLCCSKCECVFCKKCIKTNFGRKKLNEIKDSDDWICFKCNPTQLTYQRIACFELFEYVRRESARAATLNDPEFLSTDHSVCCKPPQEIDLVDINNKEKKKPKKKKNEDPEYYPLEENQQPPPLKRIKLIVPKPTIPLTNINNNTTTTNNNNVNNNNGTFITPITATIFQTAPVLTPILQATGPRPLAIHRPRIIRNQNFCPTTPTLVRINTTNQLTSLTPTMVTTTTTTQSTVPPLILKNVPDFSKHEWFEKTVRSTARVNSHLSYTLTTLNKAQSQAGSLEELANVHNKLQEVLSSSINSLIQIRKNLRNEFIAGIKKVHLPPRKIDTNTNKDDDDVIFVSAAPSTLKISKPVLLKRDTTLPIRLNINKITNNNVSSSSSTSTVSSVINTGEKPKGFLKVKSVLELQNVPTECIIIPDEPSTSNEDNSKKEERTESNNEAIENKPETDNIEEPSGENIDKFPEVLISDKFEKDSTNGQISTAQLESKIIDMNSFKYNVNDPPTPEVKRMKSAYVRLERSPLIK